MTEIYRCMMYIWYVDVYYQFIMYIYVDLCGYILAMTSAYIRYVCWFGNFSWLKSVYIDTYNLMIIRMYHEVSHVGFWDKPPWGYPILMFYHLWLHFGQRAISSTCHLTHKSKMSFCIENFSLVKAIHSEHAFISIHRPPPKPKQQVEATSTLVTARTVAERRVFSSNACKAHVRHNSEGDVWIPCNSLVPNARPVLGVEFGMLTSEASFASFFQAVRSAPDLLGIQRKWIQLDGKVN